MTKHKVTIKLEGSGSSSILLDGFELQGVKDYSLKENELTVVLYTTNYGEVQISGQDNREWKPCRGSDFCPKDDCVGTKY